MVQIRSKKIGAVFRLLQTSVIIYVIVWVMYFEKGYQGHDTAISGVTTKLKGVSYSNLTDIAPQIGERIWDPADYVVPPQQNSAFFITTNVVVTDNQTQGVCEESHDVYRIGCRRDQNCRRGELVMLGSGMKTGRCVPSTRRANFSVCEVYGWCPTEYDVPHLSDQSVINNARNFTVLIKNSVEFPYYGIRRRNILPWMKRRFLYTCKYNAEHPQNRFCPIFRLGDILKLSGADIPSVWMKGGMVAIIIKWDCNFDLSLDKCVPQYSFRALHNPDDLVGKGLNFRYSINYMVGNVEHRKLIKAYGIQFFITVYGKGRKFSLYYFSMNIGSSIGLLGLATLICDMFVLQMLEKKGIYRHSRFSLKLQESEIERDGSPPLEVEPPLRKKRINTLDECGVIKLQACTSQLTSKK